MASKSKEEEWLEKYPQFPLSDYRDLEKKDPRHEILMKIINKLNDAQPSFRGGWFGCGELGCVHVWWGGGRWKHEWFELEYAEDFIRTGKRP